MGCQPEAAAKTSERRRRIVPFHFPLASVLRLRESIEKREELALQAIHLEIARVRRRIDELTSEMSSMSQEREKALQNTIQANGLLTIQARIDAAMNAKQMLSESIQALKRKREAQMEVYTAARRQRRMLDDLLEQQKSAYEQKEMRRQQRALDDIVTARWQRG
jgi:flagellar protein FliJ